MGGVGGEEESRILRGFEEDERGTARAYWNRGPDLIRQGSKTGTAQDWNGRKCGRGAADNMDRECQALAGTVPRYSSGRNTDGPAGRHS